jgi:hypothetical protein
VVRSLHCSCCLGFVVLHVDGSVRFVLTFVGVVFVVAVCSVKIFVVFVPVEYHDAPAFLGSFCHVSSDKVVFFTKKDALHPARAAGFVTLLDCKTVAPA